MAFISIKNWHLFQFLIEINANLILQYLIQLFVFSGEFGGFEELIFIIFPEVVVVFVCGGQVLLSLMFFSEVEFAIIRSLEQIDDLENYLKDLEILLPMLLRNLLIKHSIALILLLGRANVYVRDLLF